MANHTDDQDDHITGPRYQQAGEVHHVELEGARQIVIPFERYEIGVILGPDGKFIGISRVGIRRSFIEAQKAKGPKGYHDVDSLFPSEEGEE